MIDTPINAVFYGVLGTRGKTNTGHRFWSRVTDNQRSIRQALPPAWGRRPDALPPLRDRYDHRPIEECEPEGVCAVHRLEGWTALGMWDRSVDVRGNCCSVFFVRGELPFASALTVAREAFPMVFARFTFPVVSEADDRVRACSFCGAPGAAAVVAVRTRAKICSTCLRRAARLVGMVDEEGAHEARVERLVAKIKTQNTTARETSR